MDGRAGRGRLVPAGRLHRCGLITGPGRRLARATPDRPRAGHRGSLPLPLEGRAPRVLRLARVRGGPSRRGRWDGPAGPPRPGSSAGGHGRRGEDPRAHTRHPAAARRASRRDHARGQRPGRPRGPRDQRLGRHDEAVRVVHRPSSLVHGDHRPSPRAARGDRLDDRRLHLRLPRGPALPAHDAGRADRPRRRWGAGNVGRVDRPPVRRRRRGHPTGDRRDPPLLPPVPRRAHRGALGRSDRRRGDRTSRSPEPSRAAGSTTRLATQAMAWGRPT